MGDSFCSSSVISSKEFESKPNSSFLNFSVSIFIVFKFLSLIVFVQFTKFFIGFRKYLFKTNEKIKKIDIEPIIKSVVDDFNNIYKVKRGINISYKNDGKNNYFINGIENRIEQIIANLLDNAISFSQDNKDVIVKVSKLEDNKVAIKVLDEGQGFKEKDTDKIFKRFYSNRPDKFGQHSGLGLNIVKNLVDLHNGSIRASNRSDQKGASMEIIFPKV